MQNKAIVILGSGRSGTSLLTNVLHALGMDVSSEVFESGDENRQGGWEDKRIFDVSRKLLGEFGRLSTKTSYLPLPPGWQNSSQAREAQRELTAIVRAEMERSVRLWGFKEPVTAQLLPLWKIIFADLGVTPIYLLAVRHPASVVKSFVASYDTRPDWSEMTWLNRNSLAIVDTNAELCVVHFERWFEQPLVQAKAILDYAGLPWTTSEDDLAALLRPLVNPKLNRCANENQPLVEPLSTTLYQQLLKETGLVRDKKTLIGTASRILEKLRGAPPLVASLDTAEARIVKLEDSLKKAREETAVLLEARDTIRAKRDELAAQRKELSATVRELTAEANRLENRQTQLSTKSEQLESDKKQLESDKKQLESEKKQLESEKGALASEVDKLIIKSTGQGNTIKALEKKREALLKLVRNIETSYAFRFGRMCTDAVAQPGRNTVMLPFRFVRLAMEAAPDLRKYWGSNSRAIKARPAAKAGPGAGPNGGPAERKPAGNGCPAQPHSGQIECVDTRFPDWVPVKTKSTTLTPVACLVSDRLQECLAPDVTARRMSPAGWRDVVEEQRPEFLLIESCLGRLTKEWGLSTNGDAESGTPLAELTDYCAKAGIPVAFWHTEPPEHVGYYAGVAARADMVYAVQERSASMLREALGNTKASHLPWAVQPALHNPVWKGIPQAHLRDLGPVMDGWADLIDHLDEFKAYLPLLESGLEILESRWRYKLNKLGDSPEFAGAIKGVTTEARMRSALKCYKMSLYSRHTLKSESTLIRMMLESAAAKALPAFHGTLDAPELEGIALCREEAGDFVDTVRGMLADGENLERAAHIAWRRVMTHHTYAHRLRTMFQDAGREWEWKEHPKASCITITKRPSFIEHARDNFLKQDHPDKEWILVLNTTKISKAEAEGLVKNAGNVRVFQLHEDFNIGSCLNFAISQARGDFWFKMDDDDYYGPAYVSDLLLNQRCCDSDLFGKRAAFIYFEADDAVYERGNPNAKDIIARSPDPHLCGATFGGRREVIRSTPFSEDFRACVDSNFFAECLQAEFTVQFADVYNFVAFRSKDLGHHTWRMNDSALQERSRTYDAGEDFSNIMI